MLTRYLWQQGVSLVEIMIGLAIVALLLSAGVPSFATFMQNSRIRNGAEAIQNGLNLARAEAVRRNTSVRFALGAATSWTVECEIAVADTAVDTDTLPDCPGSSPAATTPSNIQARSAAEGAANITVTATQIEAATGGEAAAPVFTGSLTFNGLGRAITLPPGNNATFDITNPVGGNCAADDGPMRCLRIVVTPGGQIRMCDPKLTGTDPRAC